MKTCGKHPLYTGKRAPRCACQTCKEIYDDMHKTPAVVCDYCGESSKVYFAAYGKHSCSNPICRVQHEADGVHYFQSLGKTAERFTDVPWHPPIVPQRRD